MQWTAGFPLSLSLSFSSHLLYRAPPRIISCEGFIIIFCNSKNLYKNLYKDEDEEEEEEEEEEGEGEDEDEGEEQEQQQQQQQQQQQDEQDQEQEEQDEEEH